MIKTKNKMSLLDENTIVLLLFSILTFIVFRKLFTLGVTDWIIGDHGDGWQFIWNFWWFRKVIFEGGDLFYTDYLFYPIGTHLYFHALSLDWSIITFPILIFVKNLRAFYNFLVILSFILGGYSMYLFLKYLLGLFFEKDFRSRRKNSEGRISNENMLKVVAFLGGMMYTFSPFHISKALGFFNLLTVHWLPLGLLTTIRAIETCKRKHLLFIAVIVFFLWTSDIRYFFFYFFSVPILALALMFSKSIGKLSKEYIISKMSFLMYAYVLAAVLILSLYWPILKQYYENRDHYGNRVFMQMVNVYSYVLPPKTSLTSKVIPYQTLSLIYDVQKYSFVESSIYIGLPFLTLTLSVVVWYKNKFSREDAAFFAIISFSTIFLFVLSLGESTLISGTINDVLRTVFPPLSVFRTPSRYAFLVMFYVVILQCTLFLKVLLGEKKWKMKEQLLIISIVSLIFFIDLFPWSYAFYHNVDMPDKIPDIIYQIGEDSGNYTVLNIPIKSHSQAMYLQTIHGKKIIHGATGIADKDAGVYAGKLISLIEEGRHKELVEVLKELNVKYVIMNSYFNEAAYAVDKSKIYSFLETLDLLEKRGRFLVYGVK